MGHDGVRWLAEAPWVLDDVARDWDLAIGAPFELSYHYVTAVTCGDGTPAVLKLGVPTGDSLAGEAPAFAAFDGRGAVRLLRADLDSRRPAAGTRRARLARPRPGAPSRQRGDIGGGGRDAAAARAAAARVADARRR